MSRSFRKDLGLRPQGYRTPSPPCHSVEPLTPATTDGGEIIIHQGGSIGDNLMESKSQDPLSARAQYGGEFEGEAKDAFAAAARVTTSTRRRREQLGDWGNHNAARFEEQVHEERPLKRIKNGQSQPPEACGTDSTAISINDGCLNIRRDEAELLLNFSREACFSVPKPPTLPPRVPFVEAEYSQCQSTPRASFSHSNKQRHLSNPQQPFLSSETMETQGLVTENPRKNSVKSIPGRQQLGDRADSSELPHWATRLGGALGQNNTGKVFDHQQDHDEMKGEEAEFCEFSYHSLQIAQPDRVENFIPKGSNQSGGTLVSDKESRAADTGSERTVANPMDMITSTETTDNRRPSAKMLLSSPRVQKHEEEAPSLCASCKFLRNSLTLETENNATSWINCDGCKSWFHFACAGFRNEREVRSVDKYRCKQCKPKHGATTYVRKSTRAHSAIDYAGLNEGVIKTSDETSEHHYIKPIKDGIIKFNPESFARMRPELVTAEYFERGDGMKEPVVIPAEFNPRPRPIPSPEPVSENQDKHCSEGDMSIDGLLDQSILHENFSSQFEYEIVPDNGQDALDMVMPQDLTVRKVAQLYGPDEKIEVIDVKSQNGEDKKWNLRQWVDYYEKEGSKVVRNVISLEVSQSNLGRLIRRPKIVRDLDLQDAVWPGELKAKGDYPKVQLYCLMSVADCFTDFHIDFGGSSVFYHILKGKKTFFFIPPHEKNLKKYEEWCMSPAQNWTFLGDQTQECFRVDLSAGDTMLIPAGWIHAVWTPEDSLVIGGNFLTRMHYEMQIRVAQIEKVTGVARKFRYPQFQKLLWYSAVNYLEEDPLPESVTESLLAGQVFEREFPRRLNYDAWGKSSKPGAENYHARYYSIAELDGLPELGRYLQRTALIAAGNITDGISTEIRNAVKRSIPKGHGEPLDFVKKFAIWYTWKRGNEPIPHWAYPDYVPEGGAPELTEKKLGTKALRRLEREAALQAWRVAPDRQSSRRRSLPQNIQTDAASDTTVTSEDPRSGDQLQSDTPVVSEMSKDSAPPISDLPSRPSASSSKKRKAENLSSLPAHRRGAACETCRKRRRACTHKAEVAVQMANNGGKDDVLATDSISIKSTFAESARRALGPESSELGAPSEISTSPEAKRVTSPNLDNQAEEAKEYKTESLPIIDAQAIGHNTVVEPEVPMLSSSSPRSDVRPDAPASPSSTRITDNLNVSLMKTPGRAKACKECRKSKVCKTRQLVNIYH